MSRIDSLFEPVRLQIMSKRLQVLFEEEELTKLQEIARQNHMTLAEWVRQTLREAASQQPARTAALKRQAVRRAIEHEFPWPTSTR